jgi:hypothetical protein
MRAWSRAACAKRMRPDALACAGGCSHRHARFRPHVHGCRLFNSLLQPHTNGLIRVTRRVYDGGLAHVAMSTSCTALNAGRANVLPPCGVACCTNEWKAATGGFARSVAARRCWFRSPSEEGRPNSLLRLLDTERHCFRFGESVLLLLFSPNHSSRLRRARPRAAASRTRACGTLLRVPCCSQPPATPFSLAALATIDPYFPSTGRFPQWLRRHSWKRSCRGTRR